MKNHDKRRKEMPGLEGNKDAKGRMSDGVSPVTSDAESQHPSATAKDTISFHVDFWLVEGQIKGRITHSRTETKAEFDGLHSAVITQFMKKYLSGLEKGITRADETKPSEPLSAQVRAAPAIQEESGTRPDQIQSLSYRVIPAGYAQASDFIPHGQPFQLQWSMKPPSDNVGRGSRMSYKVIVYQKPLAGGRPQLLGEIGGEIDAAENVTASIQSEPLPPGTYRLESDAWFSLTTKKPGWSGRCHDSRILHVN